MATVKRKNQDYANGDNPFQNFCTVEHLGIASVENGILMRMADKMQRIANVINNGEAVVKDERVVDTLSDLRNYANILQVWLEHGKKDEVKIENTKKGIEKELDAKQ